MQAEADLEAGDVAVAQEAQQPLVTELAGAELGEQMLLQLAVGMGARGEADRRPLADGGHQRARLVGRHAAGRGSAAIRAARPSRRSAARPARRAAPAAGSAARMDLLVAAKVLDHPLQRALREAAPGIVDQPRRPPPRGRCRPAPRTPAPTAARARPRPARTASRWCARPGPDPRHPAPGCARGCGSRDLDLRRRRAAARSSAAAARWPPPCSPGPAAPRPRDRGPAAPAPRRPAPARWRCTARRTGGRTWPRPGPAPRASGRAGGRRHRPRPSRCSRSLSAWWRNSASRRARPLLPSRSRSSRADHRPASLPRNSVGNVGADTA